MVNQIFNFHSQFRSAVLICNSDLQFYFESPIRGSNLQFWFAVPKYNYIFFNRYPRSSASANSHSTSGCRWSTSALPSSGSDRQALPHSDHQDCGSSGREESPLSCGEAHTGTSWKASADNDWEAHTSTSGKALSHKNSSVQDHLSSLKESRSRPWSRSLKWMPRKITIKKK